MTDEEIRRIESEYWAEYRRIKHEQIKFIVEHKSSLAGVYALYQRLPGETYLFNLDGDVIYYRMVADAIEERYPDLPICRCWPVRSPAWMRGKI